MLEIAGGILLAVAVVAVVAAAFRYFVLALSAAFCLAITAGAWLLLSSEFGQAWATVVIVVGWVAVASGWRDDLSLWWAKHVSTVAGLPGAKSAEPGQDFGRK